MTLGSAFKITADNPVGRQQIMLGYETHNKFICDAKPYTDCHQTMSSVNHRELKRLKPSWMPSPYDCFHANTMSKMVDKMVEHAKPVVDSSPPELAWNHRRLNNRYRKMKVSSSVYKETQATEVQWSDQEAQNARDAFLQMDKSINRGKSIIDTRISENSLRYMEFKRQDLEKKLPVINEPMHPHGSPLNKPRPIHEVFAPEGTPLGRAETIWKKPSSSVNRDVAIGVPDPMGDKLRVVAPPAKKSAKPKPLPEKLLQTTVANGWEQSTNAIVQHAYLIHAGHSSDGGKLSGTTADLTGLVERNGGLAGGRSSRGGLRRSNQGRQKAGDSRASTPVYSETTCMYTAQTVSARLTKPGSGELTVRKDEKVFILEDGSRNGYFRVVNREGQLGEVPCQIVNFTESVPAGRLQPARNGLGPSKESTQLLATGSELPQSDLGLSDDFNEHLGLYETRDSATPNSTASARVPTDRI